MAKQANNQDTTGETTGAADHGMVRLALGGVRPIQPDEPSEEELRAEFDELERESIEKADPGGAFDIVFGLEETLYRVERASTTLRLVASTDLIDSDISGSMYLLTDVLADGIEAIKEAVNGVASKTRAFARGYLKAAEVEKRCEDTLPEDILDRMSTFLEQQKQKNAELRGPDAKLLAEIETLRLDWSNGPSGDEDALREHLEGWNKREEALRAMRPQTLQGALAKVEFARWYAEAAGSMDPAYRGLDVAMADLTALAAA